MKLETRFDLREKVTIPLLDNADGVVISFEVSRLGTDYNVRYFHAGKLETAWLFEDELKKKETH